MPEVRPLRPDDVDAAAEVMLAALPAPSGFETSTRIEWLTRRTRHLLRSDPEGSWVAVDEGRVTGAALAIVRDGIWGLSMLAVHPDVHARGTGGALLRASLSTLEHARAGLITSSQDPRAMRLYARAGFDLHPSVAGGGIVDREAIPAGLAAAHSDDYEAAAALAVPVRGGAYGPDDLALIAGNDGFGLLLVDGRGFAVHHPDGSPSVVCATDDEAAVDLLWSCLAAGTRGATVHVDFITARQDWAVRTCLAAGLPLSPEGPVFTKGPLGPLRPWLPSGAFL